MTTVPSIFMPAFGKIVELGHLDDFVWATLRGWGALPANRLVRRFVTVLHRDDDPEKTARRMADNLKSEETELRLIEFANEQAEQDYPYLFSLVTVRLWAMVDAAVKEFLVEGVKQAGILPKPTVFSKLRAPLAPFIGADPNRQAELVAEALLSSVEGQFAGVGRFEEALGRMGFPGELHSTTRDILTELAEARHCVVHRDAVVDSRLVSLCPWLGIKVGGQLPTTLERYWYYRTATYLYVLNLVLRWARWRKVPHTLLPFESMERTVLEELVVAWKDGKRISASSEVTGDSSKVVT